MTHDWIAVMVIVAVAILMLIGVLYAMVCVQDGREELDEWEDE